MPFCCPGSVLTLDGHREVDLTTIGIFDMVGLPYALKFAWAPLVDRLPLPLLDRARPAAAAGCC
jgi:PAT family beta-lactamase induction signal transducer AmpG